MTRLVHRNPVAAKTPDSYMRLIRQFPLRPIRSRTQYDAASAIVDGLAVREASALDAGERDYLKVLGDLIDAYDDQHASIPRDTRTAHAKLKALIVEHEMTHADLAGLLGVKRPLASLILSGKRRITADHARRLADRFKLDIGYFLNR